MSKRDRLDTNRFEDAGRTPPGTPRGAVVSSPTEADTPTFSPNAQLETELDEAVAQVLKLDKLTHAYIKNKLFSYEALVYLINRAREVVLSEPMLVPVEAPVNICGDIHGQLHDLKKILSVGPPPENRFLFLGDYVDRGKFGIESLATLLYFKVRHPTKMYLLRGNHESEGTARQYGFFDECKRRYEFGTKLFKKFVEIFTVLPVAGLVEGRALCMHGGLSQDLHSLDLINKVKRPYSVPDAGLVCDLLWADPEEEIRGWGVSERGVSHTFGSDVVHAFTEAMDLDLIVRAHQVMDHGYNFFAQRKLVTVFSASNYCGEFTNWGAMLMMDADLRCKFMIVKPDYGNSRQLLKE